MLQFLQKSQELEVCMNYKHPSYEKKTVFLSFFHFKMEWKAGNVTYSTE